MREQQSSLRKALTIIDAFGEGDVGLTMVELADRTGLPRSTAHRLISDLIAWGGLERTPNGLRLGLRLFELGHLVSPQRALREEALPYLQELYEMTHKTVNLAVHDGHDIVYVEKLTSRGVRIPVSRTGGRLPLHCTALGKAILAFSPNELVEGLVGSGLRHMTPKTITDPTLLRKELAAIRDRRIAYDIMESGPNVICVAAPLLPLRGGVIGALSVTGLDSASDARLLTPAISAVAKYLSRKLSADGSRATHSRGRPL